ncbi:MAG TPA: DUF1800 family protein [Opitutaceae bacterium]|nr:DUF1800 family protein [Opitutaceae bacterium]
MNTLVRLFSLAALVCVVAPAALHAQRVANLSTRTQVGTGINAPIIGFVVEAGEPKQVLIRAAGPALSTFGLNGLLSNPRLEVFDGAGRSIANNDNWTTTSIGGATTFNAVGAFPFTTGSRDAALLATLPPGSYTAQVNGVGTPNTGLALIEVYDVSGPARLINLSTRSMVGTGGNILISGVIVAPGSESRKLLVRAAGPALSAFGLTGVLADPAITVLGAGNLQVASNDNWGSGSAAALAAASNRAGAFAFSSGSRDAALIVDLAPGSYSVQVSGTANTTGLALVELYDITTANPPTVSIAATVPTTDTLSGLPAVFTVTRTGSTAAPLTVYFEVGGSAIQGVDYQTLPTSITVPAGATSASLSLLALPKDVSVGITPNKSASISLASGPSYTVAPGSVASATIFYNPGSLYASSLRVPTGVTGSTASGSSILQLSTDNTFAIVNVSFTGLSSAQTVAYLRYGDPGQVGVDLLRLPNGQVSGYQWTISPSGNLSAADIVQGIKDGRVYLAIETANLPTGELRGSYLRTNGSLAFAAPAAPPALPNTPLTAADAARFLTQATFGGTKAEIDALTGRSLADLNAWITAQINVPATSHDAATDADFDNFSKPFGNTTLSQSNRQAAWWNVSVTAPDQLRQRMAFALSQIFVVSENNAVLINLPSALASYYDLLAKNAFGNFRTLLEQVTLSPSMGIYLSHLRNGKATFNAQGVQTTFPDENYAREVMQLFSIGIDQLHPDGTLKLDPTGAPIPTYDQRTITEMAKVFTGWGYASTSTNPSFQGAAANYLRPMQMYQAFHDVGTKTIVGGRILPANQTGNRDLADALDTLFQHPNTGPFISRQLIQRLVTSNPSPGYIYRVAQAFDNNGAGVRGDLGAVVRAILLDYEARSATVAESASFGKLREPVLRVTGLLRSLNGGSNSGRVALLSGNTDFSLAQTPLRAPTVFNFFEPNYVQPGSLASAGLFAPEYQILNDTTAMTVPNFLWTYLYNNRAAATDTDNQTVGIRFDAATLALAATPQALVDQMNLTLASGSMPKATTDRIVAAITAMPAATDANRLERVRSAIYLTLISPNGAIQK